MNDFNKELDRYLEKRKGGRSWWSSKDSFSSDEKLRLKKVEEEIKMIDEIEKVDPDDYEELEEVRESLLDKFFNLFRFFERKKKVDEEAEVFEYVQEEAVMLDEDLKEVLKITYKWLEKLPPKEKVMFKNSTDFIKYKNLLEKYGLVKKKD